MDKNFQTPRVREEAKKNQGNAKGKHGHSKEYDGESPLLRDEGLGRKDGETRLLSIELTSILA